MLVIAAALGVFLFVIVNVGVSAVLSRRPPPTPQPVEPPFHENVEAWVAERFDPETAAWFAARRERMLAQGWTWEGSMLFAPPGVTSFEDDKRDNQVEPDWSDRGWRLASPYGACCCLVFPAEEVHRTLAKMNLV